MLLSWQFFGQFKVIGLLNKPVIVLLSQPHASRTADESWCAEHSFWSAAWGWNAQVLSGKMCKNWQDGCMVLPPGERVFRSTYLFHLFVQQKFTCKLVSTGCEPHCPQPHLPPPFSQTWWLTAGFSDLFFFFFLPLLDLPVAAALLLRPAVELHHISASVLPSPLPHW